MQDPNVSEQFACSILGDAHDGELRLDFDRAYETADSPWAVPAFRFDIVADRQKAGTISFRIGNDNRLLRFAGHIGFGVDEPFRGRRLAGRAVKLLYPLAKSYGLNPLWLLCNPDNFSSMRVMEWLGAVYVETIDMPPDYERYYSRGERQKRRYRLDFVH